MIKVNSVNYRLQMQSAEVGMQSMLRNLLERYPNAEFISPDLIVLNEGSQMVDRTSKIEEIKGSRGPLEFGYIKDPTVKPRTEDDYRPLVSLVWIMVGIGSVLFVGSGVGMAIAVVHFLIKYW